MLLSVAAKAGDILKFLVENMGRINFSHGMDNEVKGLLGNVTISKTQLTGIFELFIFPKNCLIEAVTLMSYVTNTSQTSVSQIDLIVL